MRSDHFSVSEIKGWLLNWEADFDNSNPWVILTLKGTVSKSNVFWGAFSLHRIFPPELYRNVAVEHLHGRAGTASGLGE